MIRFSLDAERSVAAIKTVLAILEEAVVALRNYGRDGINTNANALIKVTNPLPPPLSPKGARGDKFTVFGPRPFRGKGAPRSGTGEGCLTKFWHSNFFYRV